MKIKCINIKRATQDTRDIADGEIFVVYKEQKRKYFKITEELPNLWAFAMKMKGNFCTSKWASDDVGQDIIEQMKGQILTIRKFGWSGTGEEMMDDVGERRPRYHCVYCNNFTFDIDQPCRCRGITLPEKKKPVIDLL